MKVNEMIKIRKKYHQQKSLHPGKLHYMLILRSP